MSRKTTRSKDAPAIQPKEMPVELGLTPNRSTTGMRPSPGVIKQSSKVSPAKSTPSSQKRTSFPVSRDQSTDNRVSVSDPDSDWLEEAKYPLKHTLCVDALTRGFYDAFCELFRLTHTSEIHDDNETHPKDRTETETAIGASFSDDELVFLRNNLCAADAAKREGMYVYACLPGCCCCCFVLRVVVRCFFSHSYYQSLSKAYVLSMQLLRISSKRKNYMMNVLGFIQDVLMKQPQAPMLSCRLVQLVH